MSGKDESTILKDHDMRIQELERRVGILLKGNPMLALGLDLGSAELFPKEPEKASEAEGE
ncbi:MAG TPA: hypothetical protein ENH84_02890 [Phycisphaerae bacterium]|nr:hypothetical protein [Phycisphaerae bacterium]